MYIYIYTYRYRYIHTYMCIAWHACMHACMHALIQDSSKGGEVKTGCSDLNAHIY